VVETSPKDISWVVVAQSLNLISDPSTAASVPRCVYQGILCFTAVCGVSFCYSFSFFSFSFCFSPFFFFTSTSTCCYRPRGQADPPPYLCFFLSHRHQGYDVVPHMVILFALYPLPFRFEELPLPFRVFVFQTPETYRNLQFTVL